MKISGAVNPVYDFKINPKSKPKKPKPLKATVKKGKTTEGNKWFHATMKSGHIGIFRRKGDSRKVKEVFGPATAGMFKSPEPDIVKPVTEKAQETLAKRLDHEIGRLLGE